MAYSYPAMVAWNPGTNTVVKNTVFQVYAPTDTTFTSPLAITDNQGNTLGNLNSGSQGVFPNFRQAQYATVVVSDVNTHTYNWTVPCSQLNPVVPWAANTYYTAGQPVVNPSGDTVIANVNHTSTGSYDSTKWTTAVSAPTSQTAAALRSNFLGVWQPNTAYASGQAVLNPSGDVVTAKTAFTSGASYNSANWSYSTRMTPGTSAPFASQMFINLKDYNPTGGGADDTTAFNNAITAAANKLTAIGSNLGQIYVYVPADFYRLTNLTVPQGVYLFCDGAILGPNASSTGPMITFNSSRSGIEGAYLAGGAVVGCSAVSVGTSGFHVVIRNCNFDNWDGRAIYDQGVATTIENVFAQNCLLGANSLAGYTGVVELAGTDAWMYRCEVTASRYSARGASTNKYACALSVTGANNMCHSIVAETSDHGVYVGAGATQSQFVGVRGELCYGHGWLIVGGSGEMVACHALRNSQSGNNLFDGFNVSAGTWTGRALYSESGGSNPKQNHGLIDTNTSQSSFSTWDIKSVGDNIARFNANSGYTSFIVPDNPPANMDAATGVPYGGYRTLLANNTAAQNVTAFSNAVNGQRITIRGDGFTTLVNGANIATLSGSNLLLATNTWYDFVVKGGVITQMR